jgi:hemoglobin
MTRANLFAMIGGDALRAVIVDFYDRVFDDIMIGFLFIGKDKKHLIDREWEFTAHFLGGPVAYTGRPIKAAHAKSPIFGGHFERRLQILRNTLVSHKVDAEVAQAWIDHQLALRSQVTGDAGSECKNTLVPPLPSDLLSAPSGSQIEDHNVLPTPPRAQPALIKIGSFHPLGSKKSES